MQMPAHPATFSYRFLGLCLFHNARSTVGLDLEEDIVT
jgi:hypothetical protein